MSGSKGQQLHERSEKFAQWRSKPEIDVQTDRML